MWRCNSFLSHLYNASLQRRVWNLCICLTIYDFIKHSAFLFADFAHFSPTIVVAVFLYGSGFTVERGRGLDWSSNHLFINTVFVIFGSLLGTPLKSYINRILTRYNCKDFQILINVRNYFVSTFYQTGHRWSVKWLTPVSGIFFCDISRDYHGNGFY